MFERVVSNREVSQFHTMVRALALDQLLEAVAKYYHYSHRFDYQMMPGADFRLGFLRTCNLEGKYLT